MTGHHLPDDAPMADLADIPILQFPTQQDVIGFRNSVKHLMARVVVKKLPDFACLRRAVCMHIPHEYSDLMKNQKCTGSTWHHPRR